MDIEDEAAERQGMIQLRLQEQAMALEQQAQPEAQPQPEMREQLRDPAVQQQYSQQRASGPGMENAQGMGNDPSRGGVPPALNFPAATRENQAQQRAVVTATQSEQGG